jgi:hypothetical protein
VPTEVEAATATAPAAAPAPASNELATTGSQILFMASFAVALMALGMVLVGMKRMVPAVVTVR